MEENPQICNFDTEKVESEVTDIFSGNVPLEQSLQKLRTRLLDLSSRNRLLNYKHPKGRSIQFVDQPNLNLVFNRLIDNKSLIIKYVPDPPPNSYTAKRPDPKIYAESLGFDTDTEFPPATCGSFANKHTPKLQALFYPADLDKMCRKVGSEARTVIEETGTNMLYLVFGFLEFYEREDSEKPTLSPLLAVPVSLERGPIDPDTRTYQYSIEYSGEDIHENQTLREKISQDFLLQMPEFDDEDDPGLYFTKIQQAIEKKKRWKVRHQLTLGFLSFGKLAIWKDLDPNLWPRLLNHPLLKEIFSGGSGKGASLFPEDYDIDKHVQCDLPVIYDADSSQQSAIIDVLSGKNMVINGPPGTGKSQTITNVIAAGLKEGKKILFVSEKLAALEIVRHRLNQANMGHFCLEFHSHKTQKKKLLGEIQERMDQQFNPPLQLQDKLSTLRRYKKELNRYAELMASRVGNRLGLSVYEVFWRTERRRQVIGDLANSVQSLFIMDASNWSYDHIEHRRAKLEALGQLFDAIGSFDSSHPWWGFTPQALAPGDNEAIGRIITEALALAERLFQCVSDYQDKTGDSKEPPIAVLQQLYVAIQALPNPPANIDADLLPRVFSVQDPLGKHNRELLNGVICKVELSRELNLKASALLVHECELDFKTAEPVLDACTKELADSAFSATMDTMEECVSASNLSFRNFERIILDGTYPFLPIHTASLETLDAKLREITPLSLGDQPIRSIREGAALLFRELTGLGHSLERVIAIANRRGIDFDCSPAAIARFGHPDGIEEVLPGILIDDAVISRAQEAAECLLSDLPLIELHSRQLELHALHKRISSVLKEMEDYAKQLDLVFDGSQKAVARLATLGHISSQAPAELLDYRHSALAHPKTKELLANAEDALASEKVQRETLASQFYLDVLPDSNELKNAIRTFRGGDSFFNLFNSEWRSAKKLFNRLCKTKAKRKAADYEVHVSSIVSWMEHRESFIGNNEFNETFGPLFNGLSTDFSKIRRLHSWYMDSQTQLLKHPGFIGSVDLTCFDAGTIDQLAALSDRLDAISEELNVCRKEADALLKPISAELEQETTWSNYNQKILQVAESLKSFTVFLGCYVKPEISPKRALEVLCGKLELFEARQDFEALKTGVEIINKHVEPLLPGIGSIPCIAWNDYLAQLAVLATATNSLGEILAGYDESNPKLRDIRCFFESKLCLDAVLMKFSSVLPATSWESYLAMASRRIKAASELVDLLKPAGQIGKTVQEVIDGLKAQKKAIDLILNLTDDAAVITMLQGHFQGFETDLDSLAATLSWGGSVVGSSQIRNASLKSLLLNSDASCNFIWAKQQLHEICKLRERIQIMFRKLEGFGTLTWDAWNVTEEGRAKSEFSSSLLERVEAAANDIEAVLPWSKYNAERIECKKMGIVDFVAALEQKKLPSGSLGAVYEFVAYRSIGRGIYKSFPELEGFAGAKHEKKRSEFVGLDKEIIGLTGKSFAYDIDKAKKLPSGDSGYRASERTEMQLLWHELGKKRRHIPIRQLIKRSGRAIQELKPCFMMGPMSVAQYLEQGSVEFDMIVMDEASQLRPEEALGAIARGKQLVVVGDPKQLPPTNFFDRLVDVDDENEDDAPAALAGSESILDICQQLFHPVRTLRWHYRSQHESLIAFSNHHFYSGKLVVFPSPFDRNTRLGVRYRYVKNGIYKDRQNVPEAQRVVDSVVEHMINYPEESLGVVTLNQTQRDLIEDLLDKKLRNIHESQKFISKWREEGWPFFVKNLENVQGDERDVIFISSTFGKALGADKVRQNFGPISRPDGWRRLNVLFTRARRKVELFTSMLPEDIVLDAKTPAGTKALKDYLDFAKRGVLATTDISGREPDSDFEISVGDMLRNRGYDVVPQLGVAGFFIDLAVRNPDRPGEFLAAVECDGATYHSSKSARDRDRIRQAVLESLGWNGRIWRIWSTDWFYSPRSESERLITFLEERRALAKSEPLPEYDFEADFDETVEAEPSTFIEVTEDPAESVFSVSAEELFVEVGDLVTYCQAGKPDERHSVMIVDTESNPRLNLINENAPLAQALLNSSVGDEPELEIKGSPARILRVLKIQRQTKLALPLH